jgi:secondary thiamine-phosphate synthase enzyme
VIGRHAARRGAADDENERRTSNIEHQTTLAASVVHSMFDVRCSMFDLRLQASLDGTSQFLVRTIPRSGNRQSAIGNRQSFSSQSAMTYQRQITLSTRGHRDVHDLTGQVRRIVAESRVQAGLVNMFNVGSTGALGIIEYEPGLAADLPELLDKLIPPSRHYGHEQAWHDGNGHSHLQATVLGQSLTAPVQGGDLALGTWQQIFHLECDIKPRQRTVLVTVLGD